MAVEHPIHALPADLATLTARLTDRYRIDRELGAGGMATVYLAHDLRHQRRVALKVLKPELAAVVGAARFLAEIKTTANLQHPHILPLHDSGEVDGTVFYVMPFVDGESLRDRLSREKQLPVEVAVRIASEVADALHYAHGLGIVHRDIKPENILLQGGHALVADFGIALAASSTAGSRMTETGMSLGTPAYMSPEQATGDRAVDGRSDVYSLAAMTYEMLVGDPPHMAGTAQAIMAKVLTERPASVRISRPTVPEYLDAALARALEKLAADRYPTAGEFAEALAGRGVRALYYRDDLGQITKVAVTMGDNLTIGERRVVVAGDYLTDGSHPNYDVGPAGRFLLLKRAGDPSQTVVIHNWGRELRAKTMAPR